MKSQLTVIVEISLETVSEEGGRLVSEIETLLLDGNKHHLAEIISKLRPYQIKLD